MSKVETDQGLGPGSERQRRDVQEAQKDLDSRTKQKAAAPAVDKTAVTEPGVGKVERKSDTVDDLLDGFGTSRPDLPRILPKADTTPPPDPVRKELTPTSPGQRQRVRNMVLVTAISFAVVIAIGIGLVKLGQSTVQTQTVAPTQTTAATTTTVTTAATQPTETIAPITTMAVDSLPTAKTSSPSPSTTKSVHSATTTAPATTTTTAAHPTGSAPPGMNLLPDDPHR